MATPIIPSPKIKGKHKLNRYIRDTYAGYQPLHTTHIPLKMTTEELHRKSTVNVTYQKHMGIKDDYYRYYYYKTQTQKKPEKFFAMSHPVLVQRRQKGEQQ